MNNRRNIEFDYNAPYLVLPAQEFKRIKEWLYQNSGIALSEGKRSLVEGRLMKRLRHFGINNFMDYIAFATSAEGRMKGELQKMLNLLTTNETYFFREQHHFDMMKNTILPAHNSLQPFRVWSAASSSGEEAYSIAMVLARHFGLHRKWEVWGTDISTDIINKANKAIYPVSRIKHVPNDFREEYLLRGTGKHVGNVAVIKELRNKVVFEPLNLISSSLPETMFDLIFCRNVLIYFDNKTREKVVKRLVDRLKHKHFFFTGNAESLHMLNTGLKSVSPSVYWHE